jgi:hypothetical protein
MELICTDSGVLFAESESLTYGVAHREAVDVVSDAHGDVWGLLLLRARRNPSREWGGPPRRLALNIQRNVEARLLNTPAGRVEWLGLRRQLRQVKLDWGLVEAHPDATEYW